MIVSIHQPQYWPWLGLIDKIQNSDVHVILDDVQFNWRAFQHRTLIRASNQQHQQYIQVPYVKSTKREKLNKVQIAQGRQYSSRSWQEETVRILELNYQHTPYCKMMIELVAEIIKQKQYSSLASLNSEILKFLLSLFEIKTPLMLSSELKSDKRKDELMLDLTLKLGGDVYLSGVGAKAYMNDELFHARGVEVLYQDFVHPVYNQHESPFVAGLSCLDILFNLGPEQGRETILDHADRQLQEVL